MKLTVEQVVEMAPDASAAAAGKKLMAAKNWPELGQDADAVWGKCQGSAVYQIKIDLSDLGYNCSCPSRKLPCKHVLGLLMLFAESPDALAQSTRPEWVDEWLQKRKAREQKKSEPKSDEPKKPVDEKAQRRRVEKRESLVSEGVDRLDLWLKDLVRNGLAGLETKSQTMWQDQARRLVDAQAPGLASRVSRIASIPGSSRDWPQRLLCEMGRLKLLLHAWQRVGELDAPLASDVRQIIGWSVDQGELEAHGDKVDDSWVVIGQWVDEEERVRAQRSWVVGRNTGRKALVLQFSAGGQPFAESIVAGTEQNATLAFYLGASRQRARFTKRDGSVSHVQDRIRGAGSIDEFLTDVSDAVARQPWLDAFGAVLRDVTLVVRDEKWFVRDTEGRALQLAGSDHWKTLAITSGHPFDLTGEWNGDRLKPLGLYVNDSFRVA